MNNEVVADDREALKQAFLRGAGIPADAVGALTPELMELLGKLMNSCLQGTIDLLALRSLVKQEVKADVTVVVMRNNNPLKFFPDRRAKDRTPTVVELALDTSGKVVGLPNSDFRSPRELGLILANSSECQTCIVKQLFRYAYGRRETDADRPMIGKATDVFRGSQFRLKDLIMFLARSLALPDAEGS